MSVVLSSAEIDLLTSTKTAQENYVYVCEDGFLYKGQKDGRLQRLLNTNYDDWVRQRNANQTLPFRNKTIEQGTRQSDGDIADVKVNDSGVTLVEVSTSSLPDGAATKIEQEAGNLSLSNIDTNLGAKGNDAASSDAGTFSLISLFKRALQKFTRIEDNQTNGTQKNQIVGTLSALNTSTTLLNAGDTFTGTGELNAQPDVLVSCKTDQNGTLFTDFSNDGTNWDTFPTLGYDVLAGVHEIHNAVKGGRYFRVRFTNTSASNQTYLRLYTYFGIFKQLNAPLNSTIQQDADALTVRTIDPEIAISRGLFEGYSIVQKFGRNGDIDTGSVPEDIWNGGGAYAGFPTGAPEEFQVFSSSASDTGVLTFTYLASTTSTSWQTATVTLNGTTPVDTGITGYRMHTAQYNTGASTTFNVGTITVRHKVTTANIFCVMPIGRSQTNVAAYTIPFGYTGYIRRLFCRVIGSTSGIVDGALWIRGTGMSPRLRRPFTSATADAFEELPYGGIAISAQSDIMVRISSASANNLDVIAGYDLILIKN